MQTAEKNNTICPRDLAVNDTAWGFCDLAPGILNSTAVDALSNSSLQFVLKNTCLYQVFIEKKTCRPSIECSACILQPNCAIWAACSEDASTWAVFLSCILFHGVEGIGLSFCTCPFFRLVPSVHCWTSAAVALQSGSQPITVVVAEPKSRSCQSSVVLRDLWIPSLEVPSVC